MSAFDPKRTLAVHCSSGFDADLSPYQRSFEQLRCRLPSLRAHMREDERLTHLIGDIYDAFRMTLVTRPPESQVFLYIQCRQLPRKRIDVVSAGVRWLLVKARSMSKDRKNPGQFFQTGRGSCATQDQKRQTKMTDCGYGRLKGAQSASTNDVLKYPLCEL